MKQKPEQPAIDLRPADVWVLFVSFFQSSRLALALTLNLSVHGKCMCVDGMCIPKTVILFCLIRLASFIPGHNNFWMENETRKQEEEQRKKMKMKKNWMNEK